MTRIFSTVIGLLLLSACAVKPVVITKPNQFTPSITVEDPIPASTIDSLLELHNVNGVSVSYINDRYSSWTESYGYADDKKLLALNNTTQFQAAEISQTLATLASFVLIQADKISLDTDISSFIVDFKLDNMYAGRYIALRNLLKHRGGFNVTHFDPYNRTDTLPTSNQILKGEAPAKNEPISVVYEPLKTLQYSEGGYHFMQMIIEKIMRESYSSFVSNYIFYPLKMSNSSFTLPIDTSNASTGFMADENAIMNKWNIYPQNAASGLWTTSEDLAKMLREILMASHGKSRYIELRCYEEMVSNSLSLSYDYDKKTISYTGQNEGYTSHFSASTESRKGIVIMTNSANGGALINDIFKLFEAN